jgi:single-stranded-DNA-specific exonuclease
MLSDAVNGDLRSWKLRSYEAAALEVVKRSEVGCHLPPLVQKLLAQRGLVDEEAVDAFLTPRLDALSDPFEIPDMDRAIERLLTAIDLKQRLVLYGDYDVDGVTSLTILTHVFRAAGLDPRPFLPHRKDEGYGLSREGLARCLADDQPHLLMAVDCGTGAVDEIAWLREQGIDVIVLDHHEVSTRGVPECSAVVNPKRGDTFHYLCTAGLAWKMGHALLKRRRFACDLRLLLDVAAIGTVADIVPLVDENRLLVAKGLKLLSRSTHVGLEALKKVAGVGSRIKAGDVGFRLGPRLNAAGRLDTAQAALDLLLSTDVAEATEIAAALDAQNKERQAVQQRMEREALALVEGDARLDERATLVIGSAAWHAGVVGIVASKIVRKYARPTFVISINEEGIGKGSGRSLDGVSLVDALNDCSHLLLKHGGHDMAAGLSIEAGQIDAFRDRFDDAVREQMGKHGIKPRLWLDAELRLEELGWELMEAYEQLEPFGMANPQPLFLLRKVGSSRQPQIIKDRHRRLYLRQGEMEAVAMWFDGAEHPLPPPPWDVAVTMERSEYRGEERLSLHVTGLRAAR